MALINCPDCDKPVSSNAPACPGCGAPIAVAKESAGSGVQLTTTQETSKRLKLQMLLATALICAGAVGLIGMMNSSNPEPSAVPGGLIFAGLVWFIVTRFRIWWHHK